MTNELASAILESPPPDGWPENSRSHSDGSLLRRWCDGSEEAAAEIYRRFAPRLAGLVRSRCSAQLAPRLDVDDVVQSAFRSFFRMVSANTYEAPQGQDLWRLLLTIALNKVRAVGAFHRAAKRDVRLTSPLPPGEPGSDDLLDRDEAADTFLRVAFDDALSKLPAQQRVLVNLRLKGHDVAEIAALVGRSKRTVERGLQQALARLKELFQEDN